MDKKTGQTIAGVGIGIFLTASVALYCKSAGVFSSETESGEMETTTHLVQIKPVSAEEIAIKNEFQLGEDVEIEKMVWNISGAEIVKSYGELDEYYKNRDELVRPTEWIAITDRSFTEERQFLVLKYTVTNNDTEEKIIYPGKLDFYNKEADGQFQSCLIYYGIDGRGTSENVPFLRKFEEESVIMAAGATMEFEYVIQFCEYESAIYDLYVALNQAADVQNDLWGISANKKVCLNIAPKHAPAYDTDVKSCYEELRDIPAMKCRQWTNLDMKAYQEQGYPERSEKEGVVSYEAEEVVEQGYEFMDYVSGKITDSRVLGWNEMPETYKERGYLDSMAQKYEEEYGIAREDMKLLLLDISFTCMDGGDTENEGSYNIFEFYNQSYLFTRDTEGKRWVFGTMDDWVVTSNTAKGNRTGHINLEKLYGDDKVALEAVYILPPQIYENYKALYFCGGDLREGNYDGSPVAEILIK